MPKQKTPKSEEARRSQLRLILAAAGFFVIAVIGSGIALCIEIFNSPGFKQLAQSVEQTSHGGGHSESSEEHEKRARTEIASDRLLPDKRKLLNDEYEFGDWLYQQGRFDSAKDVYADGVVEAKKASLPEWECACLARVGYAMHRRFYRKQIKPDASVVERALELNKKVPDKQTRESNAVQWTTLLGQLYTDNEDYAKAESALSAASRMPMNTEDRGDLQLASAELYLRKGNKNKAVDEFRAVSTSVPGKDADSLYDIAYKIERPDAAALSQQVDSLWRDRKYAELDQLAQKLRTAQSEWPDGKDKLTMLYDSITQPANTHERVQLAISKCEEWSKQDPKSPTPHIIAASIWREWAWQARGGGWADSVSTEGWAQFGDRLTKARSEIDAAFKCPQDCPMKYVTAQGIALGQQMDKAEYQKLVDRGLKAYPNFTNIYTSQAWYLQPRWYGSEGEWNRVAQRECDKLGGTAGDIMYSRVVMSLSSRYDDVFSEAGADWERTKRGFEAAKKKYPDAITVPLNEVRLEAIEAGNGPKRAGNKG